MTGLEMISLLMMPVAGLVVAGGAIYFANHIR